MEGNSFIISFDVPLKKSKSPMHMQAIASLRDMNSYYVIHSFNRYYPTAKSEHPFQKSDLPYFAIAPVVKNGKKLWVHLPSQKETIFSAQIGKAIEIHEETGNLELGIGN